MSAAASCLLSACWLSLAAAAGAPQVVTVLNPAQSPPDGGCADSVAPIISPDGRFVLFASAANNLVTLVGSNAIPPVTPAPLNVFLRDRLTKTTTLVSVSFDGTGGDNDDSLPMVVSTNGRFALFESGASNLVPNDTNNVPDVFVRDLVGGTTLLVSVATNGGVGNGPSQASAVTPDGRYVVFLSGANNLVTGDTNGIPDVFVRDLQSGTTTLASPGALATMTKPTFLNETPPDITPDGRYVVFHSTATNLVPGATTSNDIYVTDLSSGTIVQASAGAANAGLSILGTSQLITFNYVISSNGQFVAYEASPTSGTVGLILRYNVQSGLTDQVYTNAAADIPADSPSLAMTPDGRFIALAAKTNKSNLSGRCILVWDSFSGATTLASGDLSNSVPAGSFCDWPTLSPDGRFVAFISNGTNLVTNALTGEYHLYQRDLQAGTTTLVDADTNGIGSVLSTMPIPAMSEDGRFIAFECIDGSLGPNAGNRAYDVFVRDLSLGATELISSHDSALPSLAGNGPSRVAGQAFSADGRYLVFTSAADNLVSNDTNAAQDVFVRDLLLGTNLLVSVSTNGLSPGDGVSRDPAISSDGRYVAFSSAADNLVAGDINGFEDVFVRDLQAGTTTLVSVNTNGTGPGNAAANTAQMSADGRFVLFYSKSVNLAAGSFSGNNLFLRDLQASTMLALTTSGASNAFITPNGRDVAYGTISSLNVWDTQLSQNVYTGTANPLVAFSPDARRILYADRNGLHGLDVVAKTNWLISTKGLVNSSSLRFSGDGRFLIYAAWAGNPIVTLPPSQVYLYDFVGGTNLTISMSWNSSSPGTGSSDSPDISSDGRYLAYRGAATNTVPNDVNGVPDVFLFDRVTGDTTLLSASRFGNQTADYRSVKPVFNGSSQMVAFETWACDVATPPSYNFSSSIVAFNVAGSGSLLPFSIMVSLTGQGPVLSWPAVAGRTYVVQYKVSLGDTWQSVAGQVTFVGSTAYFADLTTSGTQRFYRVLAY